MAERSHLSIGEVLSLLREEFPDVTISKIRFLESQGLVDPERTPSGYRKFYDHDVERLRWILRQQREHFLPLKVIKGRLTDGGEDPADPAGAEVADIGSEAGPEADPLQDQPESYTIEELAAASSATPAFISELQQYGLLVPQAAAGGVVYFPTGAIVVARTAAAFAQHGVEARHLRSWRNSAEREASLFEQVVMPLLRQRNPQSRHRASATLAELADLGGRLRQALVLQALRDVR